MSAPGDDDPAITVRATDLMALGALAARLAHTAPDLARRPGTTATRPRGQGHEIREIRPFAEGDDPRHLDAAATARTGSLQVRSFHEDRDRTVMLIADFRRPMLWGTGRLRSVAMAEALAIAGWQAVADGGSAGVAVLTDAGLLTEGPVARTRGMARVAGCLALGHARALAALGAPIRPLAPDLVRAGRLAPRGATVILASSLDDPGPGLSAALDGIRRRGALRLLLPLDPFEADPPAGVLPFLGPGGATTGAFHRLPEHRADRRARLAAAGIPAEDVPTEDVPTGVPRGAAA